MKKTFKKIIFASVVIALIIIIAIVIKNSKFSKLEGYMYSFAAEITGTATDSNATSCDATSSNATSSNATSSNATSSNATSSNATSSNATSSTTIKVTNNNTEESNLNESQSSSSTSTSTEKNTQIEATPVVEETEEDFEYSNSEITKEIIEEIVKNDESRNITVTIDTNTTISKELFETIKGTSRQLTIKTGNDLIIFNGKDITNSKDIDATISYSLVESDSDLNVIGQNGVIINFADNGELPGTATVRIKVTDDMRKAIALDTIYVYYYNEANKELIQMSNKASYKDGYIEFAINHNSKYIFVNAEIPENDGIVDTDDTVTFLESKKMYIIVIIIGVFTIVFVAVILIVDKKTKGKANKQKD